MVLPRLSRVPRAGPTQSPARRGRASGVGRLRRRRCARTTSRRGACAQGESGFAWSWLGAALAVDDRSVRRRHRARPALPPGDRRPGHRDARGDVPGPLLGGARQRRGGQRARHRRSLAAEGPPQRAAATSPSRSSARCSRARRSRTTAPSRCIGPRLDAARPPAAAARRRRSPPRRRRWVGGVGRWARHRRPAARRARAGRAGVPRMPAARAARAPGARRPRRHRRRGAGRAARTVAARTCSPRRLWDLEQPEDFDATGRRRPTRRRAAHGALVSDRREPSCADRIAELAGLGFDRVYLHGVGTGSVRFLDAFARTRSAPARCRRVREDHRHQRPVVEEGGHLLPRRRDLHGRRRRRRRRLRRALPERIDYLADLGVTCLWLMPFYPTPDRDDGYDITDFYGVDPRLGNLGDFVEVIRTAQDRGMRVIVDLVVNHTSDQHPWFRRRSAQPRRRPSATSTCGATSRRRSRQPTVFPGEEDERLGVRRTRRAVLPARLLPAPARPEHRQPARARRDRQDRSASGSQLGVSGFRVDAVPFLIEPPERRRPIGDPHELPARPASASCSAASATPILLGEVNLPLRAAAAVLRRRARRRARPAVRLPR